jgi:phage baseplate assembly protein W
MVKASLSTLLHTRIGERVMRPDVGNNLHLIPFEQNDVFTRDQSALEVRRVFASEPRARLEGIEVTQEDNDESLKVTASVVNEQSSFVLEVAT